MKKIFSVITAAAVSVCGAAAMSTNAENSNYSPVLYFETDDSDSYDTLPGGKIFINSETLGENSLTIGARAYIDDKRDNAGHVIIKWQCADEHITLTNLTDPFTIAGAAPYADCTKLSDMLMSTNVDKNFQAVTYQVSAPFYMSFTGNASDDYPVAGFDAVVDPSIPVGEYEIYFMTDPSERCMILYRFDDMSIDEVFPAGVYTKNLKIAVSDRELGDVDGSGKYEATDASMVLRAYAELSSGHESGLSPAEAAAADVSGDGMISSVDASYILKYYAYLSGNGTLSMADYLRSEMNKK